MKLSGECCEYLEGWKESISFPTCSSVLASLLCWPQWAVSDPQVLCPKATFAFLTLTGCHEILTAIRLPLLSLPRASFGWEMEALVAHQLGTGVLSQAALPLTTAFSEIRTYTTIWRCSLLTPQLQPHSKCGYHKILENSPNYYHLKKNPKQNSIT